MPPAPKKPVAPSGQARAGRQIPASWGMSPGIGPLLDRPQNTTLVVAQLGQSLDGRIATPTGESRWINKDAALDHVHRVRASVDAVVVGVGTVVADDPLLNVRRVEGPNPARVVIDPSGRCPANARCLDGQDGVRRVVIRADHLEPGAVTKLPQRVEIIKIPATDGRLDPHSIVKALATAGLPTMLIEGGAWTVSEFINAKAVDRLHVLVAPVILGSGKTGLCLTPITGLSGALRPKANVHVLPDGDVLFDLELAARQVEVVEYNVQVGEPHATQIRTHP